MLFMDPEISPPDYLPEEVLAWARENRGLLELVVEELLTSGSWPSLKATTRKLAREGRPIPLERLLNGMPRPLGFLDSGPDRRIVLLLHGLRMTYSGQRLLAGFSAALRVARERYAAEGEDDPVISRADIANGATDTDPYVGALGEVLLREAPFLGSGSGFAYEDWTREVTPTVVQYWDAPDAEAFLRIRAEELRIIPQLGWVSSASLADGESDPIESASIAGAEQTPPNLAYDVFVSHASEDKETIARPLAEALAQGGWSVWLDELELTVGDSLSGRIDAGLANARFGVVILSPAFFSKPWPQRELAGLAAREIDSGSKVILPVWHDVDHQFIVQHSPVLADRLGVRTNVGIAAVAEEISVALGGRERHRGQLVAPDLVTEALEAEGASDEASLFSIPTTAEEQNRLSKERPDWWEYRLYAGALMQGRIGLEGKWHDHELQLPRGQKREPNPDAVHGFLSQEIGWMRRQVSALDRVFDPAVLEKAFGKPDELGDAERITHVAQGVIQIYESMMDWAAGLRNTSVPNEYEELLELTARMADGPVRQIREFVQIAADQIAQIPVLIERATAEGATRESPMTITLTLHLALDEDNQRALHAELERIS
jgi:TIR domain